MITLTLTYAEARELHQLVRLSNLEALGDAIDDTRADVERAAAHEAYERGQAALSPLTRALVKRQHLAMTLGIDWKE